SSCCTDSATTEIYTLSLHDALPILKNDVDHEREPPPEPVAEQAEDERAHGTHCQGDRDRVAKIGDAGAEIVCHRHDHKRQQKKRSEEHTSELQSLAYLVCRLLLEKK